MERLIFYYILLMLPLEAIVGSSAHKYIEYDWPSFVVLYIKYLLIAVGFLVVIVRNHHIFLLTNSTRLYSIYLSLVVIFLIVGFLGGVDFGSYLYLYIFPVLIFFIGCSSSGVSEKNIIACLVVMGVCSSIFGLIDYFIMEEIFWLDHIEYGNFISDIKNMPETVLFNLPGNFYFDPYYLKIRRLVGLQGDPLAFAYNVGFILMLLIYKNFYHVKVYKYAASLMFFALLLTLTRAVYLILILTSVPIFSKISTKNAAKIYILISLCIVLYFSIGFDIMLGDVDSSTAGHLNSIADFGRLFEWKNFFAGSLFSNQFTYFEPALMNLLFNFGFFIFFSFVLAVIYLIHELIGNAEDGVGMYFSAGLITMAIFSQSLLSIGSSAIVWLLAGYFLTKKSLYE